MSGLPLPLNFFRCPPLRSEEKGFLQQLARTVAVDVINNSRISNPSMHWRLSSDHGDVHLYEGIDQSAPPGVVSWGSVTHVKASLQEVADLFTCEPSTEGYRNMMHVISRHDTLDCAHLYSITNNDVERIDVRWFALKSPLPGVVLPRDLCNLDVQQPFEWEGRQGFVVGFTHIDMKCCPDFRRSLGLIRMRSHRAGYVFLETNIPGQLEVTHLYQINMGGTLPRWVIRAGMKVRLKNVRNLDRYLREKRLSQVSFLAEAELIPVNDRSKCFLCQAKFSILRGKTQCRKCGEVMCRLCTQVWTILNSGIEVPVTVCTPCSLDPSRMEEERRRGLRAGTPPTYFHPNHTPQRAPTSTESVASSPIVLYIPDSDDDFNFVEDGKLGGYDKPTSSSQKHQGHPWSSTTGMVGAGIGPGQISGEPTAYDWNFRTPPRV
ncbi:unnamed protein product [Aphanomyces euteiches]|uniref:FYVE-type domain-containing protein n=1 Tax=Aphanomyces euteiches TaxID=100861 RepID=A0A6G0WDK4_9STRA|nr:hypothetical protein Ae201684_016618 [Aphanomyces euteiches]KAH9078510.1 hypothetical protein Ae201684P_019594 [Aphanomyces euteiches]KAH9131966.1 hypothetical protein AeRB84_021489 [Aphanomyces euteiches]